MDIKICRRFLQLGLFRDWRFLLFEPEEAGKVHRWLRLVVKLYLLVVVLNEEVVAARPQPVDVEVDFAARVDRVRD